MTVRTWQLSVWMLKAISYSGYADVLIAMQQLSDFT